MLFKLFKTRARARILRVLAMEGKMTVAGLCEVACISAPTARKHLKAMVDLGVLTCGEKDKGGKIYRMAGTNLARRVTAFLRNITTISVPAGIEKQNENEKKERIEKR